MRSLDGGNITIPVCFQIHGGYENIIELNNNESLSIFTGSPYERYVIRGNLNLFFFLLLISNNRINKKFW